MFFFLGWEGGGRGRGELESFAKRFVRNILVSCLGKFLVKFRMIPHTISSFCLEGVL